MIAGHELCNVEGCEEPATGVITRPLWDRTVEFGLCRRHAAEVEDGADVKVVEASADLGGRERPRLMVLPYG